MLLRLSTAVLLSVSAFSVEVSAPGGHGAAAAPATTVPADDSSPPTTLDNPFLPEDANIGDCISAVPRPECGSKARGGWRQGVVFGAVAIAMVVIGTRLVVGVRKRDRARTS